MGLDKQDEVKVEGTRASFIPSKPDPYVQLELRLDITGHKSELNETFRRLGSALTGIGKLTVMNQETKK